MGFLSLQKEYDIQHIVGVYNEKKYGGKVICIGSPYVHDLIVISMEGEIIRRDDGYHNDHLKRYMEAFDADPEKLKRIVTEADDFSEFTTPVYICECGKIRKEYCKEIGWPNVTTTGEVMYNNTSFNTFQEAFEFALESVKISKWSRKCYRAELLDDIKRVFKRIKYRWNLRFEWLYVNITLRIKLLFLTSPTTKLVGFRGHARHNRQH